MVRWQKQVFIHTRLTALCVWKRPVVRLRTAKAFIIFTSSTILGGRSIGSHPVWLGPWYRRSSICVFFFMPGLHFGISHGGRGLGSVRSFSGTKTLLTIWLELYCPGEGLTSTRNEGSNNFDDLRLQKLARVSFVSLAGRRPALQQGSCLHPSQFPPTDWLRLRGLRFL